MHNFTQMRRTNNNQPIGYVFSGLLIILVLLIAGFVFVNSAYLNVGKVVVEGNKYMAVDEIYHIAEIPEPVNILKLNTGDIRDRLKRDLRISDADVSRKFPSTIIINIKERQPIAYIASDFGFVEVDQQGVILAAYRNLKQVSVPMITGLKVNNNYVGDTVENQELMPILEFLSLLDEAALNQISEVHLEVSGNITAYTIGSSQIRIGKAERIPDKAKLTNEILKELAMNGAAVEYIDLNFASPFIKFK